MENYTNEIKEPSKITKEFNENLRKKLPFDDDIDFKEAQKGFIATDKDLIIKGDAHPEAWNLKDYEFLNDEWKETVNPSLWRQAKLNLYNGLYKVHDRVYQVRSYDLSNITIVEGDTGLIVIDPLSATETAKAAMNLYYENIGNKPVKAVIHTHSHIDHYGGVKGVISQDQVDNGEIEVIAPEGFMEEAVSENIFAGTAMFRRANYMIGTTIPKSPVGQVDVGLGKIAPAGVSSLIHPTKFIGENTKLTIDGVEIEFTMANETEAPVEFMLYFPQFKVFDVAEVVTHNIHNIYTLRGAKVRDARKWWKAIDNALKLYGNVAEVMIAQHHWPKWGNKQITEMLINERDAYKFLHDQTLKLLNQGYTPVEIAEKIKLPEHLGKQWYLRDYYGSVNHDVKAIYQFYLGWYDGNPSNLYNHPPEEAAKRYVDFMGGADEVLKKSKEYFDKGDYRWVAEVCKHVVFADPSNKQAKYLQADALEQLGYQTENGTWRNNFLTGAAELRNEPVPITMERGDAFLGMPTDLIMDFAGIMVKKDVSIGKNISINLNLTDRNEKCYISLENSVLAYRLDYEDKNPDIKLTLDIPTLIGMIFGKINIDKITSDSSSFQGESKLLKEFLDSLESFDGSFNIVTP